MRLFLIVFVLSSCVGCATTKAITEVSIERQAFEDDVKMKISHRVETTY